MSINVDDDLPEALLLLLCIEKISSFCCCILELAVLKQRVGGANATMTEAVETIKKSDVRRHRHDGCDFDGGRVDEESGGNAIDEGIDCMATVFVYVVVFRSLGCCYNNIYERNSKKIGTAVMQ